MLDFQFVHQGSTIAKLIDEIVIVFCFDEFVVSDDKLWGSDGGEDFDFVIGALWKFFVLIELVDGDGFDCELLTLQFVLGPVDSAVVALADHLD